MADHSPLRTSRVPVEVLAPTLIARGGHPGKSAREATAS